MPKDSTDKIYSILLDMKQSMGEMSSDIKAVKEHAERSEQRVDDIAEEVKGNSEFINNLKGRFIVIGVVVTMCTTLVVSWVRKEFNI